MLDMTHRSRNYVVVDIKNRKRELIVPWQLRSHDRRQGAELHQGCFSIRMLQLIDITIRTENGFVQKNAERWDIGKTQAIDVFYVPFSSAVILRGTVRPGPFHLKLFRSLSVGSGLSVICLVCSVAEL